MNVFICVNIFRWSLWYLKADKSRDWKDNLKLVISFDTVSYKIFLLECVV